MTAPDLAARAAAFYAGRLGWALTPIEPGTKGPRQPGWQERERCIRDADAARAFWTRHPDYGMGVVHAWSGTCTLDADGTAADVARALAAGHVDYAALLGAPGPRLIGNPTKPAKLLYRVPAGVELRRHALYWPDPADGEAKEPQSFPGYTVGKDRVRVVFELRAGTVQDVLPPSIHPGTGEPYRWAGTGCPRTPEDVPLLPAELLHLWLHWTEHVEAMRAACPWAPAPRPVGPKGPEYPRRPRPPGESVIARYVERVPAADVLARNGYTPTRDGRRWTCPGSTTGTPGVVLLDDGRVYSHHASDRLAGEHAHDSFSLLCTLEHNGDVTAAVRAAAAELGLPPREHRNATKYACRARERRGRNRRRARRAA